MKGKSIILECELYLGEVRGRYKNGKMARSMVVIVFGIMLARSRRNGNFKDKTVKSLMSKTWHVNSKLSYKEKMMMVFRNYFMAEVGQKTFLRCYSILNYQYEG